VRAGAIDDDFEDDGDRRRSKLLTLAYRFINVFVFFYGKIKFLFFVKLYYLMNSGEPPEALKKAAIEKSSPSGQ